MKKVISLLLTLALCLSLCACGSSTTDKALSGEDESSAPATNEPFTFRGITFASTRDEIKEVEGDNISFESSILMRVLDVKLGGYNCWLCYNFHDKSDEQKLTSILYQVYGHTHGGTEIYKEKPEAELAFETIATLYTQKYGAPQYTSADMSRPCFNKLDWNTDYMDEGPAYKPEAFAGDIEAFYEWLVPDGDDMVDIVVYQKYYPKHMQRVVSVLYTPGVVDTYVETMSGI